MKTTLTLLSLLVAGALVARGAEHHDDHDHDHEPAFDEALDAHPEDCDHDHDHAEEEAAPLAVDPEIAARIGMDLRPAAGGPVTRSALFPAEVVVNRDRAASVAPRYPGPVRALHAELGAVVQAGDPLATLENRETLATYVLAAPISGTITARNAAVGDSPAEGAALFEMADLASAWVEVHIYPQYRQHVKPGQPVTLIASDGHEAEATIDYVHPLISRETRTLQARCILNNPGDDFPPGTFARARIAVEATVAAVRVERDALQTLDGESVVFVAAEDGYAPRPVETGLIGDTHVEIRKGLELGERYLARGAFVLKAALVTGGLDAHAGHGH